MRNPISRRILLQGKGLELGEEVKLGILRNVLTYMVQWISYEVVLLEYPEFLLEGVVATFFKIVGFSYASIEVCRVARLRNISLV